MKILEWNFAVMHLGTGTGELVADAFFNRFASLVRVSPALPLIDDGQLGSSILTMLNLDHMYEV